MSRCVVHRLRYITPGDDGSGEAQAQQDKGSSLLAALRGIEWTAQATLAPELNWCIRGSGLPHG